jgi:Leucine-rich repeat (LRR) protein
VDFSHNDLELNNYSSMFNALGPTLETLKLKRTKLQNINQIPFKNVINLKYLDLSFNNLSSISNDLSEFLRNLEYLDLSSNSIYEFSLVLNKLRYLNLEKNLINATHDVLEGYYLIEVFKMAYNKLQKYPSFEMRQINSNNADSFLEFYLNHNQINEIKYFSFTFGKLLLVNFDSNQISSIEKDAFLNCRSLESLSIAQNRLRNLTENNFHFLFSLTQLNLSFNEISLIENRTFKNLNKLKSLDLNYNRLISIENDLFFGLMNLNDLFLLSQSEMTFYNQSFHHIAAISTIVLNESLINKYKCLFMHTLQKDLQRNVSNRYIFYKSINLISLEFSFNASFDLKCDLTLELFQFKIHYNLKTDYEVELFYDFCQTVLIKRGNNYNHTKRKCLSNFEFEDREEENEIDQLPSILKVLSNFYYLLSMALILSLLLPSFFMVFRFELFSDVISYACNGSSDSNRKTLKELDRKIEKILRRKHVNLLNDKKLAIKRQALNDLIQKDENKLLNLEYEKNKELQNQK